MTEGAAKITIRDLEISFGANHVLRGVDFDLNAGKSLVVIGASGSGKSVLLKCILGILRPDRGSIALDGENILRMSERQRMRKTAQIGMLFQGAALFDSLKVWENVAFRLLYGERKATKIARRRAMECLGKVGLAPEVGELFPSALSGGMQKRVALARAIAAGPDVLFFDEPTTGLDPITADVINSLIIEQVRALGATAISITHDMISARKIADEVAMIHEGRIVWRGSASDLDTTDNPMVRQFVEGRADGPIKMKMRKT